MAPKKSLSHFGPGGHSVTIPPGGVGKVGFEVSHSPQKAIFGLLAPSAPIKSDPWPTPPRGRGVPALKSLSHSRKSHSLTPRGVESAKG